MVGIKFITGQPALCIRKTLVITDLHLGIEYDFHKSGIKMPSQTEDAAKRIESLIRKTRASRLVILGDIKHKVPGSSFQEAREIPRFFGSLSDRAEIEIIKGNHDGGIERHIPPETVIHGGEGFLYGDYYLCHGHAMPDKSLLKASVLITGHAHPVIEIRDSLGYRWVQKVWMRAPPIANRLSGIFGSGGRLREIIAMPAFSDFVGGRGIEKTEPMGPVMKMADMDKAGIYLLDGTYVGCRGEL